MNLRILVYLNPSCIDRVTHKINLESDSGWCMVKDSIEAINKICDYHFYILFPERHASQGIIELWPEKPSNVTLVLYPYTNDALTNRYHLDVNALSDAFNCYRHDIDLIWTMLPENVAGLKAFMNKRREEVPIVAYCNWMDHKKNASYEPEYKYRMLEGAIESSMFLLQSVHHKKVFREIIDGISNKVDLDNKVLIINPKAIVDTETHTASLGREIAFPHRVDDVSGFQKMFKLCREDLKLPIWVTNINKKPLGEDHNLIVKHYHSKYDFFKRLAGARFGLSYHVGYSMWSMAVIEMMALGKCVLVPAKNAFPEMFDSDYPFMFKNDAEFREKIKYMQNPESDYDLIYWGKQNRKRYEQKFTYTLQATQLSNLFESLVSEVGVTKKADSVETIIRANGRITKQEILNKGLSDFGRLGSRAWNKARINVMQRGIKDDVTFSETIFYTQ